MEYEDIRYEADGPCAVITIDRQERLNAFRGRTVEELIHAFQRTWTDSQVYGIGKLAFAGLDSFAKSDEANEGRTAFADKRDPDFSKFR